MRARLLHELSALVLGAVALLVSTSPAQADHPSPLPDTITTPAPTYTIHYTNDNPYTPPAIATSDLNYLPTAQAQAIANAMVNSNAAAGWRAGSDEDRARAPRVAL